MDVTRVVIDTDPGVDDAIALFLAVASPELDVVGVTTVSGNVNVDKTTLNARRILELVGRSDIPIARGAAVSLSGVPGNDASEVHGEDGLGELTWPEPTVPESSEDAVALLYRLATEGPLTIVAIGPLTNLAHLITQHPDVVAKVERVVVMGGASYHGNVTPAAEFNVWADPEAAAITFAAGWPLTILPLDVTHQATINDDDLAYFRSLGNEVGRRSADMLEPYALFHEEWRGDRDLIMHDALAVYDVIDPTAIEKEGVLVTVETGGDHSRGATWFHRSHRHEDSTVRVGVSVDNERFVALLRERYQTFS